MQPIKKIQSGTIQAAVWRNNSKEGNEFFSVSLDKRYKDAKGEWQSSSSFKPNDLPKAVLVLQKAYEFIALHDSTPAPADA